MKDKDVSKEYYNKVEIKTKTLLTLNLKNKAISSPIYNWMIILWSFCRTKHPHSRYNGDAFEIFTTY